MFRFLIFIPVMIVSTAIHATLAILIGIFSPYSMANSMVMRIWGRTLLLAAGVKVKIEGLENIQKGESYIVIANHQSHMDIPILLAHLPLPLRIIAKKELFRIPLFGWGMAAAGILKIDRSNRKKSIETLNKAEKIMRENNLAILAFPEGTRSRNGNLQPFKKGPFILAINTKLPLLPVSVSGTYGILPRGKIRIKAGKVLLRIHPPVPTESLGLPDRNTLVKETEELIASGFIPGFDRE